MGTEWGATSFVIFCKRFCLFRALPTFWIAPKWFLGKSPKFKNFGEIFRWFAFFFPPCFGPRQVAILIPDTGAVAVTGHSRAISCSKSQLFGGPKPGKKKSKSSENFTKILKFWGIPQESFGGDSKGQKCSEKAKKPSKKITVGRKMGCRISKVVSFDDPKSGKCRSSQTNFFFGKCSKNTYLTIRKGLVAFRGVFGEIRPICWNLRKK